MHARVITFLLASAAFALSVAGCGRGDQRAVGTTRTTSAEVIASTTPPATPSAAMPPGITGEHPLELAPQPQRAAAPSEAAPLYTPSLPTSSELGSVNDVGSAYPLPSVAALPPEQHAPPAPEAPPEFFETSFGAPRTSGEGALESSFGPDAGVW